MDCSPPGISGHRILQARILTWIAMPFSRGSFWPRDRTHVYSCFSGRFFTHWTTWEDLLVLVFHLAEVGERGPRASPGNGRGGRAHREPWWSTRSAPGAGPTREARSGSCRGAGTGVPVVLSGHLCSWEGSRGGANLRGEGRGSDRGGGGGGSQLCSRGAPLRLGMPISCTPGSPWIGIQWADWRSADHR